MTVIARTLLRLQQAHRLPEDLRQRLGRLPRSADSTLWVHGDDPRLFRLVEPLLERCAADYPRNLPRFTSHLRATRDWLRGRHGPEAALPLPFPGGGCPARFLANLKPRLLIVLGAGPGPGSTLTRRLEARGRSVLRLRESDLREPEAVYERVTAGIELRPGRRRLTTRRALEARFLATAAGRAARRLRTRRFDLLGLGARLGHPETILCLGNGPSCEDPRLEQVTFDALFRVNYRWLERGVFDRPDMVFLGESKTIRLVRDCVFGFRTSDDEGTVLDRHVLRRRPRIEHFCLGRVSDVLDERRWPARPTNGMSMLATALLLRPRRLIVAGIDLFEHAEGSYPGAPEIPNGYAAVHRREVEVEIARHLLARHEGEVEIVGEPLRRALAG